jgi:uncharacterized protein (DUF427 family)
MVRAIWNGETIAESGDTVVVEGNHYFPLDSVRPGTLTPSSTTSVCPWKGTAEYCSVQAGGDENRDAAWYYAEPKPAAAEIAGRVAFWKGVKVA